MRRSWRMIVFSVAVIVFIVLSVSISYALMTQQLEIDGYISMEGNANWNVHFQNLKKAELTGNAVELQSPEISIDGTYIGGYHVKFGNTNDSVTYMFEVANNGDLDAVLSSINIPTPVCRGSGSEQLTDEQLVCSNLKISLTYADGTTLQVDDELLKGETKQLILKLTYTGTDLPLNVVDISNLHTTILYTQN